MPVRCEAAERELSARLDDETSGDASLDAHLAGCASCRAFEARARRLRVLTRLSPAEPVPDLVPAIMERVREEAAGRARKPARWRLPRPAIRPALGRAAVAFAAGALVGALVVAGLPGVRRGVSPALATEIPGRVTAASTEVTAYRAALDVVERHFHPRVPVRRFEARVAFAAPERFRAAVDDITAYPSAMWPRNDTVLSVDRDRWLTRGPATCPRESLPSCAPGGEEVRRVTGREPFDGDAPLPTDIVLPVGTLSGTDRVRVVGQDEVLGREVVLVELAYRDAVPLFAWLHAAGSWRPLFPLDRVLVSLDAESWFPLAYEVRAASSPDRDAWAQANALPIERPGTMLLRVEARSFHAGVSRPPSLPDLEGAQDHGFRDAPVSQLAAATGEPALIPADLAGLRPHRAGTFVSGGRPADEVLLSFTRGLAWLKVRQTRSWDGPHLFGDVGHLAVPLGLPGGGVAYYEPATATLGRRLSVHAPGVDLYLETNLPRPQLLRVAASIPVEGMPIPEAWREVRWRGGTLRLHVSLAEARREVAALRVPTADALPPGYRLSTVHLVHQGGVTGAAVYFRRSGAELDGMGIRYFQVAGDGLAPPLDPDVQQVRLGPVVARYSAGRGELEWVDGGVYRSVTAPTLDLATLVEVARSVVSS
jgi:Putative zinc-finger